MITTLITKDEAKRKVANLVREYLILTPAKIKAYHEAKTKQGFIQPLFHSLGWDFLDVGEVSPEESASRGRVDYAFKIGGVSRFYLETKHLKADLNNTDYIKQAVTYAYNKGVTWAGLTSFDRLRLFNAQSGQPFLNLTCQDYLDDFDRLWLLSKESIESGALDKEATKVGVLPRLQPIERRLFGQLRTWREELFTQLYHYNRDFSLAQIDEIIQRIFDRLIFIRTCEDRGIEEKILLATVNQWKSAGHKPELIERIQQVFLQFDAYYDSDLFSLHNADKVFVEASTLERIINGLYETTGGLASYDFSIIDADILGAVYEQYLGHVATIFRKKVKQGQGRLDLGLDVSLETKKEKRKEQGIYYTPKWVTDYIIKHTVGRFLAERSHHDILKMRIVDPACGSGSFLIRAYSDLLTYHASVRGSQLHDLDQWDRLPILVSNIFGVDLDAQAVEIARLNLLLKSLAKREILPSLANNVRRGNSLISGKELELTKYFGKSWHEKSPFDWQNGFETGVQSGSFDVVIGNPPYVRIQSLPRDEAAYYKDYFESAWGSFDIYVLFIEKAIELLRPGGRLGFITSGKFLTTDYGKKLRDLIHRTATVENVVDLSSHAVFAEATTYPVILILQKGREECALHYVSLPASYALDAGNAVNLETLPDIQVQQNAILNGVWPPSGRSEVPSPVIKIKENATPLLELPALMSRGSSTGADDVFCLVESAGKLRTRDGLLLDIEPDILRKPLYATDFTRFQFIAENRERIIFPYAVSSTGYELISEELLGDNFPNAYAYLCSRRTVLEKRKQHGQWYGYSAPRNLHIHDHCHLLVPLLADHGRCAPMPRDHRQFCVMASAGFSVSLQIKMKEYSPFYILGLVNSRLLFWYLSQISNKFRGGWITCTKQYFGTLPIHMIDSNNEMDVDLHDRIVNLVERLIKFKKRIGSMGSRLDSERSDLEREIDITDCQIDSAVYELYGLSHDDISLVEPTVDLKK